MHSIVADSIAIENHTDGIRMKQRSNLNASGCNWIAKRGIASIQALYWPASSLSGCRDEIQWEITAWFSMSRDVHVIQ